MQLRTRGGIATVATPTAAGAARPSRREWRRRRQCDDATSACVGPLM